MLWETRNRGTCTEFWAPAAAVRRPGQLFCDNVGYDEDQKLSGCKQAKPSPPPWQNTLAEQFSYSFEVARNRALCSVSSWRVHIYCLIPQRRDWDKKHLADHYGTLWNESMVFGSLHPYSLEAGLPPTIEKAAVHHVKLHPKSLGVNSLPASLALRCFIPSSDGSQPILCTENSNPPTPTPFCLIFSKTVIFKILGLSDFRSQPACDLNRIPAHFRPGVSELVKQ